MFNLNNLTYKPEDALFEAFAASFMLDSTGKDPLLLARVASLGEMIEAVFLVLTPEQQLSVLRRDSPKWELVA
jgi:hypothetical protein